MREVRRERREDKAGGRKEEEGCREEGWRERRREGRSEKSREEKEMITKQSGHR